MLQEKDMRENFDTWFAEMSALAQSDPEAFEKRREELIEEAISQADESHQGRLRCLQWRIDMERKRAKTPLASCLRLYDMLLEFVYGQGGFLEAVERLKALAEALQRGDKVSLKEVITQPRNNSSSAKVIPFRRSRD